MSLKGLKTHAEKFGTDGVMETVAELYHHGGASFDEVVSLQKHVDTLDARGRNRYQRAVKHRLTLEQRARRLLGIPDPEEGTA